MLSLLATLMAASQPAASPDWALSGRSRWIFATVEHSEFCPAGNVRLDLRRGGYAFVARAPRRICDDSSLERPIVTGRLGAKRLAAVRAAYGRVLAEGFESPACQDGRHPDHIVVNNGRTPILVLSTGAATGSALDDLTCWSDAASALHDVLDGIFTSLHPPSP